eukprot:1189603-Alexandrium_andersonii.AAC.1
MCIRDSPKSSSARRRRLLGWSGGAGASQVRAGRRRAGNCSKVPQAGAALPCIWCRTLAVGPRTSARGAVLRTEAPSKAR